MTATASTPTTSQPNVLTTYQSDEGTRQLVSQQVNGTFALSDIATGDAGKVYLVERHVAGQAKLKGLVDDYLGLAAKLGRCPMQSDWIFE
jgi:hypothetical protein